MIQNEFVRYLDTFNCQKLHRKVVGLDSPFSKEDKARIFALYVDTCRSYYINIAPKIQGMPKHIIEEVLDRLNNEEYLQNKEISVNMVNQLIRYTYELEKIQN